LSLSEVDRVLQTAAEYGVQRIDTAPLYGDSQILIGKALRRNHKFLISSKVGRPNFSDFTPAGIRRSVKNTLRDLGVEKLDTLFVHSLPWEYLTLENLDALLEIQRIGLVDKLGYSGDNDNLLNASQIGVFSNLMFTLNPIDLKNSKVLDSLGEKPPQLYLKRVLANGVFNIHLENELKDFLRDLLHKPTYRRNIEYRRRYRLLYGTRLDPRYRFRFFMNFGLRVAGFNSRLTLGISSPRQLLKCIREEQRFNEGYRNENFQSEFNKAAFYSEFWDAIV